MNWRRGLEAAALAVRSSAVGGCRYRILRRHLPPAHLNVLGRDALVEVVADVWASLDSPIAPSLPRTPGRRGEAWPCRVMPLPGGRARHRLHLRPG